MRQVGYCARGQIGYPFVGQGLKESDEVALGKIMFKMLARNFSDNHASDS